MLLTHLSLFDFNNLASSCFYKEREQTKRRRTLTLVNCVGNERAQSHEHEVCQHQDVGMVLQAVLHMAQEVEDVDAIEAGVQQGVHAFERDLAQVEPIILHVFEGAHLHLSDQLLPDQRFAVEQRQHVSQQVTNQHWFVVGSCVEGNEGRTSNVQVAVIRADE